MHKARFHILIALAAAACLAAAAGDSGGIPDALKPWKCPEYEQRYFLRVEAPGEAGNAGLHPDAMYASVLLPLKRTGDAASPRPERIALFGENGVLQPVYVRAVAGGSETEVVFSTYPGHRRFCIYTGASRPPAEASVLSLRPTQLMVRLRGVSAGAAFTHAPRGGKTMPLTLERFLTMEEETAGNPLPVVRTQNNPDPRTEIQANIDDPQCPYFYIDYDIFDRIQNQGVVNPQNYAALYEGFLRCPVNGKYKFALDTPGAGHVVIDGTPVVGVSLPDERREPFALTGSVQLSEGVHRVVIHYAEANEGNKTNMDRRRFGLRLHWQPPFISGSGISEDGPPDGARGLMCIPPLAFVRHLPAVVTGFETVQTKVTPFVHVEALGHVRVAAQKGDKSAREWVLACARTASMPDGGRLRVSGAGMRELIGEPGIKNLCAWIPAGTPVEFQVDGASNSSRVLVWPTLTTGVKQVMEREVMDLEAELVVKSAPEFLYPGESGHIHAETLLSPKPVIIHKTRFDAQEKTGVEMLPPKPRPMGEFNLLYERDGKLVEAFDGSPDCAHQAPDENARRKIRASFPAELPQTATSSQLSLRLFVGGLECQRENFRMLDAQTSKWPGRLILDSGELAFVPSADSSAPSLSSTPDAARERVIVLVPHEDAAAHRHTKAVELLTPSGAFKDALFIGDPLVEGMPQTAGGASTGGLSALLARSRSDLAWSAIDVDGPHRYRPLLRMLADLDAFTAAAPGGKLPRLAVVNLGSGDVARQTPLHTFERALDTLLARLRTGGAEKVIVVGVIPEPWREKHCEPYQERVTNVVNQHHATVIDLFHLWTPEKDWERRFAPPGEKSGNSTAAGPLPNAAALDEILKLIQRECK